MLTLAIVAVVIAAFAFAGMCGIALRLHNLDRNTTFIAVALHDRLRNAEAGLGAVKAVLTNVTTH